MRESLEKQLLTKGIKVWVGFANDEAYDFCNEKGVVFLTRKQCPFDDARAFDLRPVKRGRKSK